MAGTTTRKSTFQKQIKSYLFAVFYPVSGARSQFAVHIGPNALLGQPYSLVELGRRHFWGNLQSRGSSLLTLVF